MSTRVRSIVVTRTVPLAYSLSTTHAMADRDGLPVPDWVAGHRAPADVMLFGYAFDKPYARWVRLRSPAVCDPHRVWFHPRVLDKGTPEWWLPWD